MINWEEIFLIVSVMVMNRLKKFSKDSDFAILSCCEVKFYRIFSTQISMLTSLLLWYKNTLIFKRSKSFLHNNVFEIYGLSPFLCLPWKSGQIRTHKIIRPNSFICVKSPDMFEEIRTDGNPKFEQILMIIFNSSYGYLKKS